MGMRFEGRTSENYGNRALGSVFRLRFSGLKNWKSRGKLMASLKSCAGEVGPSASTSKLRASTVGQYHSASRVQIPGTGSSFSDCLSDCSTVNVRARLMEWVKGLAGVTASTR